MILCLYVDDIMLFGSNIQVINITKSLLSENLDMKDLGKVNVILVINLLKNNNGFTLTWSHYIEKQILKIFNYFIVSNVCSHFYPSTKLKK